MAANAFRRTPRSLTSARAPRDCEESAVFRASARYQCDLKELIIVGCVLLWTYFKNYAAPWQRLNFLPEPQGQGPFLETSVERVTPSSSAAVYLSAAAGASGCSRPFA